LVGREIVVEKEKEEVLVDNEVKKKVNVEKKKVVLVKKMLE
jgi:hypothetical protein